MSGEISPTTFKPMPTLLAATICVIPFGMLLGSLTWLARIRPA
jgi:hypothetical protein